MQIRCKKDVLGTKGSVLFQKNKTYEILGFVGQTTTIKDDLNCIRLVPISKDKKSLMEPFYKEHFEYEPLSNQKGSGEDSSLLY